MPPEIEASAYFLVAEALTNVVKHSQAAHAEVTPVVREGMLDVQVSDDGVGGADPDGHGLVGMKDRVATLGGRLEVASPAGGGTRAAATLPLAQAASADSPWPKPAAWACADEKGLRLHRKQVARRGSQCPLPLLARG